MENMFPVNWKTGYLLNVYRFSLYVNNIQWVYLFADDMNIFATGYCPILVSNSLNEKLGSISQRFSENPLYLKLQTLIL